MGLKLFYVPFTRAGRARWMLEELGVPHELERIDVQAKQNHAPEYLEKVHPLGHVPALHDSDGDMTMFETSAICLYLADKFAAPDGQKLAPAYGSPARGPYYQWMVYAVAELEPAVAALAALGRIPEAERNPAEVAAARAKLDTITGAIQKHLENRLAEDLLASRYVPGDTIVVDRALAGELTFRKRTSDGKTASTSRVEA
jgi:glutathione S-transferase